MALKTQWYYVQGMMFVMPKVMMIFVRRFTTRIAIQGRRVWYCAGTYSPMQGAIRRYAMWMQAALFPRRHPLAYLSLSGLSVVSTMHYLFCHATAKVVMDILVFLQASLTPACAIVGFLSVCVKIRERLWNLAFRTRFGYDWLKHNCYSSNDYCLGPGASTYLYSARSF